MTQAELERIWTEHMKQDQLYGGDDKASFLAGAQAALKLGQDYEYHREVLKAVEALKYIKGIVERGEKRELAGDETVDLAILNYVKNLEAENERLKSENEELKKYTQDIISYRHDNDTLRENNKFLETIYKNQEKELTAVKAENEKLKREKSEMFAKLSRYCGDA